MRTSLYLLLAGALATASVGGHAQSGWKPEKNIEIVIGSSAGTGPDRAARIMQRIWQEHKMVDVPAAVVNKPGGGGAISWAYLNQRAGDGHFLLITSYNIVTNHITGKSNLTYTDFTPISLLGQYLQAAGDVRRVEQGTRVELLLEQLSWQRGYAQVPRPAIRRSQADTDRDRSGPRFTGKVKARTTRPLTE
ncbi:MAG: hypothetical protein A3F74_26485 [Betaproteobacteria bacterium RIFCSPLOWO2_12_FULL_62_58]|nr:MAG: hypothetical protein A3F74_26485 [Betaproteobacteria bacterium RIFCSPLOWO2_12_FULL_62_58]